MKLILKFLLIVITISQVIACSNIDDTNVDLGNMNTRTEVISTSMDKDSAISKFAQILSLVTYQNIEIREFLKNEAIKRFDMNNDILYLNIKDKEIGNKSFRNWLIDYSSETIISDIEENVPLLNILIPEIPIFDISIENININDQDIPIVVNNHEGMALFLNGSYQLTIPEGELPNFHTIVVNENNRVIINDTRSNSEPFTFLSPYYDRNYVESHKTRAIYDNPYAVGGRAMQSFSYFNNNNYSTGLQRDFIYYGLTPDSDTGTFHPEVSEYLLFLEVNPKGYFVISDDHINEINGDPHIIESTIVKRGGTYTEEELITKMWSQGAFNFRFEIYSSNSSIPQTLRLPFYPQDLWIFNIEKEFQHSTWFRDTKYTYKIDPRNFKAKRAPIENVSFGKWDLSKEGLERYIMIYEEDKKATVSQNIEYEITKFTSSKISNDLKIGLGTSSSGSIGTEFNSSTTTREKRTFTYTYDEADDPLGTIKVYFYDPIIEAILSQNYVDIFSYNTGIVEFGITAR